jgi:3-hydroxyisobutyrate dehydrogenase-like beta-hydroxyacid dehydrogenase
MHPDHTPVTVLGLGAMGTALARVYLAAGHPTTVWNRTPGRAAELDQMNVFRAETVAAAVDASPLVIVCLLDYSSVHAALDANADALAGKVLINLTNGTRPRPAPLLTGPHNTAPSTWTAASWPCRR